MINQNKNNSEKLSSKFAYMGGGIGLGLFAVFGLFNASFIGGILGINIVGSLFGYPIPSTIIARLIIALGMLLGVMITGLVFTVGGSLGGWLIGAGIMGLSKDNTKNIDKNEAKEGKH